MKPRCSPLHFSNTGRPETPGLTLEWRGDEANASVNTRWVSLSPFRINRNALQNRRDVVESVVTPRELSAYF